MLGFISGKKFAAALETLENNLVRRLDELDERLLKAERSERRGRAAMESMVSDHDAMLTLLHRLESQSPPLEALFSFAENFILWRQAETSTPALEILDKKLAALLAGFGLELIAETRVPFDQNRHEASCVRFEPGLPENIVLELVRPGFSSSRRVLRYAAVVVNRPEDQEDANA